MKTATIKVDELKKIVHEEVKKAMIELLNELDFITEEDIKDRNEALKEHRAGKSIKWSDYLAKRGIKQNNKREKCQK